jgi:hypothetical protein
MFGRVMFGVVVALVSTSLFVACKDDEGGGSGPVVGSSSGNLGDGGSPPIGPGTPPPAGAAGDFCQKTLGVVVGALEACCTSDDKATQDYKFTHDLAAMLLPICTSTLDGSITKQRVLYHADRADACFAAYQTTYAPGQCANITQTFSDPAGTACREAFSGVGTAGAACQGDHECIEGLTCVGFTGQSDGSCKSPPPIGDDCGEAKSDGAKGSNAASLEFGSHPHCAAGARCDSATRKCVKAAGDGEACSFSEMCASPLQCVLGKCGPNGPAGENGPCIDKDDCTPDCYCEGGSPPSTQGACKKKKSVGGTCNGSSFVTECFGRCDAPSGQPGLCKSFCGSP